MRNFFLSAAALGFIFMSCNNDDFSTVDYKKTDQNSSIAYKSKQQNDLASVVHEVLNNCKSINSDSNTFIVEVEEKALLIQSFKELVDTNYVTPTNADLNISSGVANLNYRIEVLEQLRLIMEGDKTKSYLGNENFSLNEQELLETFKVLATDETNNIPHWISISGRSIAFAKGYQQSRANAVLMAVLVQLK